MSKKKNDDKEFGGSQYNTKPENDFASEIDNTQTYAEGGVRPEIEIRWEDEYKGYQGGGKQWDTSKAPRDEIGKDRNFNSEDNFILPMIQNMKAALTVMPTVPSISPVEPDDEATAAILLDLVPSILYRNKFSEQYEKIVQQFLSYGPAIGYVPWDQHWIGGSGPNRWVGEIRTLYVKKSEFFPDPAIIDLETRLQDCSYINLKQRKKVQWIKDTWKEKGQHVIDDNVDVPNNENNEGTDPKQATLISHFHKGVPKYISKEWKQEFLKRAEQAEADDLPYKAQDFKDMASGILKGVHCAYKAGTILLDYVPYIYEDGLYPFVYRVLYSDETQPYGMGEIRNTLQPQLSHNKADEIELGAMLGQGLGGGFFNNGSLNKKQKGELLDNNARPHVWIEVDDIHGLQPRKAVQVPLSITNYKNSKKDVMDTITQNTAILQGISPGANIPYATIKDLGARSDLRMKARANILAGFLQEMYQLVINRIAQFYTEGRTYRIVGESKRAALEKQTYDVLSQIANVPEGTPREAQMTALIQLAMTTKTNKREPMTGKFNRKMLIRKWDRNRKDEYGNTVIGKEEFLPEFDIKVKVMDERPSDPNYYVDMAMGLLGKAMGVKAFWKTVDEGKFPPINEIVAELDEMRKSEAQAQQAAMVQQSEKDKNDKIMSLLQQLIQIQSIEKQVGMKAGA